MPRTLPTWRSVCTSAEPLAPRARGSVSKAVFWAANSEVPKPSPTSVVHRRCGGSRRRPPVVAPHTRPAAISTNPAVASDLIENRAPEPVGQPHRHQHPGHERQRAHAGAERVGPQDGAVVLRQGEHHPEERQARDGRGHRAVAEAAVGPHGEVEDGYGAAQPSFPDEEPDQHEGPPSDGAEHDGVAPTAARAPR